MDMLGIEFQTVFGLPPVEFVNLAADLDCRYISTGLSGSMPNPFGYGPFSLREDSSLRNRLMAAMRSRDVSISLGEGFLVSPGGDVRDHAHDMDVMIELGVKRINTVSVDPDLGRTFDEFGVLCEMARARGLVMTTEFAPSLTVKNLDMAVAAVRHVDRPDFRVLIDTMHLVRGGHTAADLAAIDPDLIGYVHLSDNTLRQRGEVYRDDSIDRMFPGEGELPLEDILAVIPLNVVIGLEVPMRSKIEDRQRPEEIARQGVDCARQLLAAVQDRRSSRANGAATG
jgi:sugar phosphate isomerase/epimerase